MSDRKPVALLVYTSRPAVATQDSANTFPEPQTSASITAGHRPPASRRNPWCPGLLLVPSCCTYSSWLAATARKEFTIRAGLAAVAQFEDEHGAFTPDELAEADQWAAQAAERASQTGASRRRRG